MVSLHLRIMEKCLFNTFLGPLLIAVHQIPGIKNWISSLKAIEDDVKNRVVKYYGSRRQGGLYMLQQKAFIAKIIMNSRQVSGVLWSGRS